MGGMVSSETAALDHCMALQCKAPVGTNVPENLGSTGLDEYGRLDLEWISGRGFAQCFMDSRWSIARRMGVEDA